MIHILRRRNLSPVLEVVKSLTDGEASSVLVVEYSYACHSNVLKAAQPHFCGLRISTTCWKWWISVEGEVRQEGGLAIQSWRMRPGRSIRSFGSGLETEFGGHSYAPR
ncbi:unnamed protein product [Calypogeia fissa]